jgi:hypothetical protein
MPQTVRKNISSLPPEVQRKILYLLKQLQSSKLDESDATHRDTGEHIHAISLKDVYVTYVVKDNTILIKQVGSTR